MIRTGIFGGTFDPVHYGHIRLAETAYNELSLDKVILCLHIYHPIRQIILSQTGNTV